MNPLVAFRSNVTGQMNATPSQRKSSADLVSANLRAKLTGQLRSLAKSNPQLAQQLEKSGTLQGVAPKADGEDSGSVSSAVNDELDRDAFLQLLVMEMQNQDPLEPMDNGEMIAQLAQFSSLEQMNNLGESFEALSESFSLLSGNMDQLNFISAQGMIGRYIEGVDANGEIHEGTVDAVHLDGSIVTLSVDGSLVPMTGVLSIGHPASPEPESGD